MKFTATKSEIKGSIEIPGSKSHTIRALFFSSLADGKSEIIKPLKSDDTLSAVKACRAFGSKIEESNHGYNITGFNGNPNIPDNIIDVGNSGSTLRFAVSTASLIDGYTVFTGDEQIRNRPIQSLLDALNNLGAKTICTRQNGKAPLIIRGKIKGGYTKLDSITSQYLTSLLINSPLFEKDTTIELIRLNEIPYIDITLWWLNKLGIQYNNDNYKFFHIPCNQKYKPFNQQIPGDFSSATFFLVLAAISGGTIELKNLDMSDPQGDKHVIKILEDMGAEIIINNKTIIIKGKNLKGREIDMNSIPDALPAMAVAGCFAEGETKLLNVPQARLKETDRIAIMNKELSKMGAKIKELDDGLIISQSNLKNADVYSHNDHRIAMALTLAGLNVKGKTVINSAEAVSITFPTFSKLIKKCGGKIEL